MLHLDHPSAKAMWASTTAAQNLGRREAIVLPHHYYFIYIWIIQPYHLPS